MAMPVTKRDHVIRKLLEDENTPDHVRNRILRQQMKRLHAIKDRLTPGWDNPPPEPVEARVIHRGSLDGRRRKQTQD